MTDESPKPNSEPSMLRQIAAGVIILALGAAGTWLLGRLADSSIPVWGYVAGLVLAALASTLIYPPWRRAVWGNVAKWRPFTTLGTLERNQQIGHDRAVSELRAREMAPSIRAQWIVASTPGSRFDWVIWNNAEGSTAQYVALMVDNAEFQVGSALDWSEIEGGAEAKFKGNPTQRGYDFGVDFTVEWTNEHGVRLRAKVPGYLGGGFRV